MLDRGGILDRQYPLIGIDVIARLLEQGRGLRDLSGVKLVVILMPLDFQIATIKPTKNYSMISVFGRVRTPQFESIFHLP